MRNSHTCKTKYYNTKWFKEVIKVRNFKIKCWKVTKNNLWEAEKVQRGIYTYISEKKSIYLILYKVYKKTVGKWLNGCIDFIWGKDLWRKSLSSKNEQGHCWFTTWDMYKTEKKKKERSEPIRFFFFCSWFSIVWEQLRRRIYGEIKNVW